MNPSAKPILSAVGIAAAVLCSAVHAQHAAKKMSFFVTSASPGKGADLGGLAGADAHCQTLAAAVGAGSAPGAPTSAPLAAASRR